MSKMMFRLVSALYLSIQRNERKKHNNCVKNRKQITNSETLVVFNKKGIQY